MGFCIYNNCAVAAHYLIEKYSYKKVAIFDPDVHHGNGTQDIFYDNENVLYLSTHQYPFYPGTGSDKEKGNHNNIFNVPLPAGTNTEKYMNALDKVLDKLIEFKPEFLIFSMGFDANIADPLAQFELQSKDFYEITKRTLKATNRFTNGKVVSVLEGGYDLNALAESALNHVKALSETEKMKLYKIGNSKINNKGLFANKDIKKGTKIINYIGKIITKKETEKNPKFDNSKAIYLYNLNSRYDLDGDFSYNTARLINHSCDPNCEVDGKGLKLWISSIKDIKKGEELSYDYGFGYDEDYKQFPCKCKSKNCCGYIVREGSRWRINKKFKKLNK